MIKVKLEIAEHLGDDGPVLWGHIHPHQHHHGPGHVSQVSHNNGQTGKLMDEDLHEVHSHDLREEQHENVGTL